MFSRIHVLFEAEIYDTTIFIWNVSRKRVEKPCECVNKSAVHFSKYIHTMSHAGLGSEWGI